MPNTEIPGVLSARAEAVLLADGMYFEDQFGTNGTINFCSVTLAQMNIEHGAKPTG